MSSERQQMRPATVFTLMILMGVLVVPLFFIDMSPGAPNVQHPDDGMQPYLPGLPETNNSNATNDRPPVNDRVPPGTSGTDDHDRAPDDTHDQDEDQSEHNDDDRDEDQDDPTEEHPIE
jgi:hypothetical protein